MRDVYRAEGFRIFGGATEFGPAGRRLTAIGNIILSGSTIRAYRSFAGEGPRLRGFNFDLVAPPIARVRSGSLMLTEAALGLALVPQEREIFRSLTVEENLNVGERVGRWTLARVYDFFPSLAARRNSRGDRLSGGEQQMLAIGRALMGNPTFLLMDEPLEGLAPVIVDQLLAGLERLKQEEDLALILVEQHAHLALDFADNVIVLDRGAIVYQGASQALASEPELMSELLGVTRTGGENS